MTGVAVHGTADTPPNPAPDVDSHRLAVLRQLGPADGWGVLPAVVEVFGQEAPRSLAEMREAVRTDDRDGLEHAAHRLKGAAANVGAVAVTTACQRLEDVARYRDERRVNLLDEVAAALDRATRLLLDVISEAP